MSSMIERLSEGSAAPGLHTADRFDLGQHALDQRGVGVVERDAAGLLVGAPGQDEADAGLEHGPRRVAADAVAVFEVAGREPQAVDHRRW